VTGLASQFGDRTASSTFIAACPVAESAAARVSPPATETPASSSPSGTTWPGPPVANAKSWRTGALAVTSANARRAEHPLTEPRRSEEQRGGEAAKQRDGYPSSGHTKKVKPADNGCRENA
jgi:hypothetical protein